MTTGFDSANRVPGGQVRHSWPNSLTAVRANPGLAILGVHAVGWLHCVFNPTLELGAPRSDSNQVEVQLGFRLLLFLLLGAIATRH